MRRGREEEYSLMQEEEADSHESQGICGIRSMFLRNEVVATRSSLYLCRERKRDRLIPSFSLSFIPASSLPGKEFPPLILRSFLELVVVLAYFSPSPPSSEKEQETTRTFSSSTDSGRHDILLEHLTKETTVTRGEKRKTKRTTIIPLIIFIIVLIVNHLLRLQTASQFGFPFLSTPDNCCHRENLL